MLHNCCIAYAVATHSACLSASLHLFCAIQCAGILRILLLTFIFFRRAAKISLPPFFIFLPSRHALQRLTAAPLPPSLVPHRSFLSISLLYSRRRIYSGRKRKEKRRKARKRKRIKRKGYRTVKERKHEKRSPLVAGWVGVYCYCVRAEMLLRRLWQV